MNLLAAMQTFEPPLWWRMLLIAIGTLILCACRAPMPVTQSQAPLYDGLPRPSNPTATQSTDGLGSPSYYAQVQQAQHFEPHPPALPPAACESCPPSGVGMNPYGANGYGPPGGYAELPYQAPVMRTDRPEDEYLCDGGDRNLHTKVGPDFAVYGLDLEDTVAHYDTIDGRREVEASNKVCIYAPRFAAVRQVRGLSQHEQHDFIGRVHVPVGAALNEEMQLVSQANQQVQPIGQIGSKQASIFRERNAGVPLENAQGMIGLTAEQRLLVPFRVLETGLFEQMDKARLAGAIDAAITWSHDHGVGVLIGEKRLIIDSHDTKLGETFVIEHEGNAAIRIIKVASKKQAQPGDIVEFTLRFDNVGDEPIGNVTILDNLTTRLEYVEDSQACTIESAFFVEQNEGQSLALRWEIIEPMEPGTGGVVTFKCRVR